MPLWLAHLLTSGLTSGLAVQFGGRGAWDFKQYAKIVVIARGDVSPEYVSQHIAEVKESMQAIMNSHPRLEESGKGVESVNDVAVEIRRMLKDDDMEASVSTSVIMSMTTSASMSY